MQKYPGIPAAVAEKRVEGIKAVLEQSSPGVIILDDAFQHRYVRGKCNVLLTTWQQPFFRDYLLPAGDLRESRTGQERADIIVVTKCPPGLSDAERREFQTEIKAARGRVFFSCIEYARPVNAEGMELSGITERYIS